MKADYEAHAQPRPTLVMLHGLLGDRHDWAEVIAVLKDVPCLALDLPGHGQNYQVVVDSFSAFHHWLTDTLVAQGIQRYCLLGYSLGGRLALDHARRQPAGLEALWLESAHPGLPESERDERMAHDARWAQRFAQEPLEHVLADWYRQPVFADLTHTQRARQIERRLANHGPSVATMLRSTSLGRQSSQWPWLAETSLPIGYFSGRQDTKFHTLAARLANVAPRVHPIALEGGHNLHTEQAKSIAEPISRWYQRLG